jgi:hypothetical protein
VEREKRIKGDAQENQSRLPNFSMKVTQTEAVHYITKLIQTRRLDIPSRTENRWVIFEHKNRQIGVDTDSGVWIRESKSNDWRCVCTPCVVSGAIQAVDFLVNGAALHI